MSNASIVWGRPVANQTYWWSRTPEALLWMWLVLLIIAMMFALVSGTGLTEFVFVQCVLSAVAAVCVTHAGLRDVQLWRLHLVPVFRVRQRMRDMAKGWCLTGLLLGLSSVAGAWVSSGSTSVSHLPDWGLVLLLSLIWHTVWVCAVYAWWGLLHPMHLALPLLVGLTTVYGNGPLLAAGQGAPFALLLLGVAYGVGVPARVFRWTLVCRRWGVSSGSSMGDRLDTWLNHWLARAGFIAQGQFTGRRLGTMVGVGLTVGLLPIHQMGSHRLLEPWSSELTFYEPWRIGFICLFVLPLLRSSQWHWRYMLSPGGQTRRDFGLNLIIVTLRFVAMYFWPFWALAYAFMQLGFSSQSPWQTLDHLALYLPTVMVDFWVAIALAICFYGGLRLKPLLGTLCVCVLLISPVAVMFLTQANDGAEWLLHLGRRQGTWLIVMTVIASALTLLAQQIWRKTDLAQLWRDDQTKAQGLED